MPGHNGNRGAKSLTPPNIRVHAVALDDEDREYIRRRVRRLFSKYAGVAERVTVRVRDVNGPRGGADIVCRVKGSADGPAERGGRTQDDPPQKRRLGRAGRGRASSFADGSPATDAADSNHPAQRRLRQIELSAAINSRQRPGEVPKCW